jgi:protein involved in polysaccharide export with SLBB domain
MGGEMQREMNGRNRMSLGLIVALIGLGGAGCWHRAQKNPAALAAMISPGPPEPGAPYRIQLGDQLHVRFLYQPDMSEEMPVRPDGRITLASTGELEVVGLTPTDLERLIVDKSSARLRNPEVTVVVTKLGEQRVYVGGEVGKPGYVALQPNMTPLQAVLQSGGFARTAKLESVLLLTPGPDGRFAAARVDMKQVVQDGVPERLRLHPNSVIYVPPTWIANMDDVVDLYVRGLIPSLPRVGAGYAIGN